MLETPSVPPSVRPFFRLSIRLSVFSHKAYNFRRQENSCSLSVMMMPPILIIIIFIISFRIVQVFTFPNCLANIFSPTSNRLLFKRGLRCFQKFCQFISHFPIIDSPTLHTPVQSEALHRYLNTPLNPTAYIRKTSNPCYMVMMVIISSYLQSSFSQFQTGSAQETTIPNWW